MSLQRLLSVVFALSVASAALSAQVVIDHRYANTDAQSLIGLPMGSHKTIVDKQGDLKWSQWSLKRKPLDTPIGFSDQMDGELAIEAFAGAAPFNVSDQQLYHGRYPFIVSSAHAGNIALEELAFAVDPGAAPGEMPTAHSGAKAFDVVRLTFRNEEANAADVTLKLSGRERNLPGHVVGSMLENGAGEDVALVTQTAGARVSAEDNGLTLVLRLSIPAQSQKDIWIELPYEWPVGRNGELSRESGEGLLAKAVAQWDGLWANAAKVEFPQKELTDFYYSSIAYVLILTEFDARGDLWALDGPAVYRQYWGRGEYFQARAMEVAGFMEPARESVEHAFHIINDDGEWDFPPTSGWPAWDNSGGNAAAVWDYYLFSRDKQWLEKAYPYLLESANWIRDHREESTLEGVDGIPLGARPIHRQIASKCRPEPDPALKPGEKTYWYGLLPWSYGDSGLPEGHSFSHNFLADYAIHLTSEAANVLGHPGDAAWLDHEYTAYTDAIRDDVNRAVTLETIEPPYLPAMPTEPGADVSQSLIAVYPTRLLTPDDLWVTNLLARMRRDELQGLPTHMAWMGAGGVWPSESLNVAETYLRRGNIDKTVSLLMATLNHTYTTDAFREEIKVDKTKPVACASGVSKDVPDGDGTGDMPEAWGPANLILLVRDMLFYEDGNSLHILAGIPAEWINPGEKLAISSAPTTLGGKVSFSLDYLQTGHMRLQVESTVNVPEAQIRFPLAAGIRLRSVTANGQPVTNFGKDSVTLKNLTGPVDVDAQFN